MATLYYSNRCPHSKSLLKIVESIPDVAEEVRDIVCVETAQTLPRQIRAVPAVVDNGTVYEAQAAFEWVQKKKASIPSPFWYENSGPSPSALFSFVEEDSAFGHRQDAFGAFDDATTPEGHTGGIGGDKPSSALDALLEKRKSEVPQAIRRQ